MRATETDADFERLSWHDSQVYGMELRLGDPEVGDWAHDLALDFDVLVDGPNDVAEDPTGPFLVAPAHLVFHDVADLGAHVDWPESGYQVAVHPMAVHEIGREPVVRTFTPEPRPYFAWTIRLNWPGRGTIRFGASGFTQSLRAAAVRSPQPHLTGPERRALLNRT